MIMINNTWRQIFPWDEKYRDWMFMELVRSKNWEKKHIITLIWLVEVLLMLRFSIHFHSRNKKIQQK